MHQRQAQPTRQGRSKQDASCRRHPSLGSSEGTHRTEQAGRLLGGPGTATEGSGRTQNMGHLGGSEAENVGGRRWGEGRVLSEGSAWAQVMEQGECSGEVAGGETAGIAQNGFGTRSQASWVPCWDSGPSVEAMGGHRQFWGWGD